MSGKKQRRPPKGSRAWRVQVRCDRCKRVQENQHGGQTGTEPISPGRRAGAVPALTFPLGDLSYLIPCACGSFTATYANR